MTNQQDQARTHPFDLDTDLWRRVITGLQPRLFAIHGIYHQDGAMFSGYGMDFRDQRGTFYWSPEDCVTSQSDSAESVLDMLRIIADARLLWIDTLASNDPAPTTDE